MIVRHFMSRNVFTLTPERRCGDALRELRSRKIRHAPVMSGDRLIGMISERRLLAVLPGTPEQIASSTGERAIDNPIQSILTTPAITLGANDHVEVAARKMLDLRIGGFPVVEGGKLVGILTESDIFRALALVLEGAGTARLLLATEKNVELDVAAICARHKVRLVALLLVELDSNTVLYEVGLTARAPEPLVAEFWRRGARLVSVDRG
jgi:acetoin utilization protein AcuB